MTDELLHRYALGIEYVGTDFHGWQRQRNAPSTVQTVLEDALSKIVDEPVRLFCAGRTDKGVHAIGQTAHFDCRVDRPSRAFTQGANGLLPKTIRIRWAKQVPMDFHARFSARARRYRYVIHNEAIESALLRWGVAWWREPLQAELMHKAAQCCLGEHDFSAFRGSNCNANSASRRVEHIAVFRAGTYVVIDITANAFLLHMVRNIAGSLRLVGSGIRPVSWISQLLATKDRTQAGETATATGLYLVSVSYGEQFDLPVSSLSELPLVAGGIPMPSGYSASAERSRHDLAHP